MSVLGNIGTAAKTIGETAFDAAKAAGTAVAKSISKNLESDQNFRYTADGNGLPYTNINDRIDSSFRRNIITWFVPEFGMVNMYVNPNSLQLDYNKIIKETQTKGGFSVQYWGESLPKLAISGTTGSAGIEGINVLEEVYRAEQLAFDGVGLNIAANNYNIANNIADGLLGDGLSALGGVVGGSIGSTIGGVVGDSLGSILGIDSPANNMANRNIPSLAQLALGVEMYYSGITYRGYFSSMSVTETTDFCITYNMHFVILETRGYRRNHFPFQKNPKYGPSAYNTPNTFSGNIKG